MRRLSVSGRKTMMAAMALVILAFSDSAAIETNPFETLGIVKPKTRVEAPAFTLAAIDGTNVSLKDFRGKIIFLNFWATWCVPCQKEMPGMEKLWSTYGDHDFVIIAVAADKGSPDNVRRFANRLGVSFPVLLDPEGGVRNSYEVSALPTTYIIGMDGKISGRIIGAIDWDMAMFRELIDTLSSDD